jgi:hypothetical protein
MANVRDYGAVGDGKTDDTAAVQHAVAKGDGLVELPPGTYRISAPITLDLGRRGFTGVVAPVGTVQIIMAGAGPALRLVGSHRGTAAPDSVAERVWRGERFPNVRGIEIVGDHSLAEGIELVRTMQASIEGVLIRKVRNGVRLAERNRNFVLIGCHIYDNSGIGVFFDRCNLHQAILSANHISYNRQAGIRSLGGDVHNVQIVGNDIEYNYAEGVGDAADVWFEAADGIASEITLSGNTIQAVPSPGGTNVRIVGATTGSPEAARLIAITGNVLGSQETNVELRHCNRVSIVGNTIYDGKAINIFAQNAHHVTATGNTFGWKGPVEREMAGGVQLEGCSKCQIDGLVLEDCRRGSHDAGGAISLVRTKDTAVCGCQVYDPAFRGIWLHQCERCRISGNTLIDRRDRPRMLVGIESKEPRGQNWLLDNIVIGATKQAIQAGSDLDTAENNRTS